MVFHYGKQQVDLSHELFIWQTTFYTFKSSPFPQFLPSLTICFLRYPHSLYIHTYTYTHTTTFFLLTSHPHRTTRKPCLLPTASLPSMSFELPLPDHFNFSDVIARPSKQCLLYQWFCPLLFDFRQLYFRPYDLLIASHLLSLNKMDTISMF